MNPTALAIFIISGIVFYLGITGRLPGVVAAIGGAGSHIVSSSPSSAGGMSAGGGTPS